MAALRPTCEFTTSAMNVGFGARYEYGRTSDLEAHNVRNEPTLVFERQDHWLNSQIAINVANTIASEDVA
ncbi:MAG: hypothetical protein ABJN98_15985 [Roseibium sp.]